MYPSFTRLSIYWGSSCRIPHPRRKQVPWPQSICKINDASLRTFTYNRSSYMCKSMGVRYIWCSKFVEFDSGLWIGFRSAIIKKYQRQMNTVAWMQQIKSCHTKQKNLAKELLMQFIFYNRGGLTCFILFYWNREEMECTSGLFLKIIIATHYFSYQLYVINKGWETSF